MLRWRDKLLRRILRRARAPGLGALLSLLLAAWLAAPPGVQASGSSAQATITLTPRDVYPPAPVTDLEATPSLTEEGRMLLLWTAPDENNLAAPAPTPAQQYELRYATFSVTDLAGDTTAWYSQAANAAGEPAPQTRGSLESYEFTTLEAGGTYFFGLKSRDANGNLSLIDSNAQNGPQAQGTVLDLPPPVVTGFAATAGTDTITLSWSASSATDVTSYRIYWDTAAPADVFTPTATVITGTSYYTFLGLTELNTYYFYVTALDRGLPTYLGTTLEGQPSQTLTVVPGNAPPDAPANFAAFSISTGTIVWQWTDQAFTETGFRVYSSSGGLVGTVAAAPGTGSAVQFAENNLIPNTSYARFVRAYNGAGESLASNTTDRFSLARAPAASAFSEIAVTSLSVTWSADGNPAGTRYELQYSSDGTFAAYAASSTLRTSSELRSLFSNTTYYARARALNGEGLASAFDTTLTTRTQPMGVQDLTATAGNRRVTLDWADNTEENFAGYFIYRSTEAAAGFAKISLTALTTSFHVDQPLTNGVTYFYKLTAVDAAGQESPFSATVSARPRRLFESRPQEPTGIQGHLSDAGRFTLYWTAVTKDELGFPMEDELTGYRIYKSTAFEGPFSLRDEVAVATATWLSPDLVPPTVWYLVRAVDSSDNESDDSMRIETRKDPSVGMSSPDQTLNVMFTGAEARVLSAAGNERGEDLRFTITRRPDEENGNIIGSYEVRSFGAASGAELKDLPISKPNVELSFRYLKGGPSAAPLPAAAKLHSLVFSPRDVGIFWNNSVEFVKFGGEINEPRGTISIKTAKPIGKFQVRQVQRASDFTLTQLTPRKIFTPNGDGVNDEIILYLENPKDSLIAQARIFDITGAEVADFQQGIVAGSQGIVSLKWDGKDRSGQTVRSGVYVYQVQAEGKILNGTIVVAR